MFAAWRQAVCKDIARRSRADHDVVGLVEVHSFSFSEFGTPCWRLVRNAILRRSGFRYANRTTREEERCPASPAHLQTPKRKFAGWHWQAPSAARSSGTTFSFTTRLPPPFLTSFSFRLSNRWSGPCWRIRRRWWDSSHDRSRESSSGTSATVSGARKCSF